MEAQIQRSPCSWNVMDRVMESCCDVPQKMSETIPLTFAILCLLWWLLQIKIELRIRILCVYARASQDGFCFTALRCFGHLHYPQILRYLRTLLDTNGRFPRRQEAENMTFIDPSGASRSALVSHEEVEAWVNGCHGLKTCHKKDPGAGLFWRVGTHNLVTKLTLPV